MEEQAVGLATRALDLLRELEQEEGDAEDGGQLQEELRARKRLAERALTQGAPGQALQAALRALEALLQGAQVKEHALKLRLSELVWLAKDAAALFAESGDGGGKAGALTLLTSVHLMRLGEPDAPMAALRAIKDAVAIYQELRDRAMEGNALLLAGEAHLAKASATPFEQVLLEQIGLSVQATKEAEEIFKQLGDKRGMAKAMHGTAKALLRHTDEDEVLEGERYADDARELFHEVGDKSLELAVLVTGISARHATSGPESALMMAKDAAEDWQQEGGRHKDTAVALLLAAGFQLELGEHEDALKLALESQTLNDRAGNKRGVASALETRSAILFSKKQHGEALRALEDMATVYQRLGDKRAQGTSLMMAANMLLNQLSEEVETDTKAESEKKQPQVGISTDDVHKRSADGLEYANRASKCFEEAGDEEGTQAVAELVQNTYRKAIDLYCQTTEPDQIYYTLSKDTPLEDATKCIKEWKIPMPSLQKTPGFDGFLHVFDPHPPPKI